MVLIFDNRTSLFRLLIGLCLVVQPAFGAELTKMSIAPELPGLHWSNLPLQVQETKVKGVKKFSVVLKGVFKDKNTDVLWGTHKIVSTQDQVPKEFAITVPIRAVNTLVQLRSINEQGVLSSSAVTVTMPDYLARMKPPPVTPNPFHFSGSVGYSSVHYTEATRPNVDTSGLTVKGQVAYLWVPNLWDMAASFYLTALPLTSTSRAAARFLGVNFRVGYVVGFIPNPWSLSLMAGGYYTTMFVSDNSFGFRNMMGPQFFPVVKYKLDSKQVLIGYAKYSPIVNGSKGLSFDQRELATGLTYLRVLKNNRNITGSVDFSNLALFIDGLAISSTSISLSVGYGW